MRILDQILGLFLDGCVAAFDADRFLAQCLALKNFAETGVGHRIGKTAPGSCSAKLTLFVDGDEVDVMFFDGATVESCDPANRFGTSVLRTESLSHVFNHHEGPTEAHDVFSHAGGSGSADFIVHVKPASQNG